MGRKDTISVLDLVNAMDKETEKAIQIATMRGTLKAKINRSKSQHRVNSNFEDFMRMAREQEARSKLASSHSMPDIANNVQMVVVTEPPRPAPTKSPILEVPPPKKPEHKEDSVMDKQIAEDDESLKVFLQAWNTIDTFEGKYHC